jgi:polysaccharide chain length determinant protein (PEP-CTERM system associated)
MQQVIHLLEQLRGVWRFRRIGMVAAWSVLLFSLLVIIVLPDRYEASATVFVDTQTALSEATRTLTSDTSVESDIDRVREALLGAPQLTKIADEIGMTARAATPQDRQKIVDKLRWQIKIYGSAARPNQAGGGTYVISYPNASRETSIKVVDRLVTSFVEETLGGKRKGSEEAQQFLAQQIADLEKKLSQAEEALATFKKQNVGLLPGSQEDYFVRLENETTQLNKLQTDLSVASTRKNELRRQLQGEQPLMPFGADKGGTGSPAAEGGDTATRLRQSQQQLDEMLLNYTDKHPKVIALRNSIKELESRLAEEMQAARRGDSGAAARTGLTASPVYQRLQEQYNTAGVEIAGLEADIANHRQRVASLRSMLNTAPEVEAQYSRLNRDYNVTKAQYVALVDQLGRTRLGEQAAQTGVIGFHVVDPARAGFDPVFPQRPKMALGAFAFAILIGVAVAFLLDRLRPVYSSTRRLQELTRLPVLGEVSMTREDSYDAATRRSAFRVAGAFAGMFVILGLFLVTQRHLVSAFKGLLT